MKNAMKKLMSLLLVAVLLVSAVPFAANAAEYTVTLSIKDTNENYLIQGQALTENGEVNYTAEAYWNAYGGAWLADYTPVKYWIKNDETGSDGLTVDGSHALSRNTQLVIKVEHKPVTLDLDIYLDGTRVKTVTKSVAYGSTVTLNDALAAEAGYGSYNTDVRSGDLSEGQSFTATQNCKVGIYIVTNATGGTNAGTNTGSSSSSNNTTATKEPITLNIKNVEGGSVVWTDAKVPDGDTAVVSDMLYYWYSKTWTDSYNCTKVYSSAQGEVSLNAAIAAGDTVTVVLTPKSNNSGSTGSTGSNNVTSNKFPYNVYLNIYKDTMVGSPDKTINITSGAALDGTVTMDEVKAVVMNYYTAKNSYGIGFDGLYLAEGTWVTNYVTDTQKYDAFVNVAEMRNQRTVYINVMISNANATSTTTYTADSSNPKTGDSIFMAVTVLGVSATALAAVMYFYNKKRQAV